MLSKFLDPKNDVAFKRIFGTERNKDILIHFINDMITFKEQEPIVDVTFLKPSLDPEIAAQKTSIVDVLCKDTTGNLYIVEMQVAKARGFEKRAQYYASKVYSSQAQVGSDYGQLKEVVFLAISDYVVFPNKKRYKSDHIILDKESYEHDLKDFSFTFLELPKFNKSIDQLDSMIEKWCYFFKYADETTERDFEEIFKSDQVMKRAFFELNRFAWNDDELLTYDQSEKHVNTYLATLAQKEYEGLIRGLAEGLEQGRAEGEAIGLNKGLAEGLAQGLAQGEEAGRHKEKLTLAKRLLSKGLALDEVGEMTGLTFGQVEELANDLQQLSKATSSRE